MSDRKLNRFSPSMLIEYMNCPRSFYFKHIAGIQLPQKQIHLLFGGGVHAAIEKGIYEDDDPYRIFEKHFLKEKLTEEERDLHEEYLLLGKEMIKNYAEIHPTLNSLYSLNTGKSELVIKGTIINPLTYEPSSLPLSGRIDRITDSQRIVEYKTSKNKWSEKDLNYKIQTMIYNLWFFTQYKELPEETIYIILLKKFKNKTRSGEVHQVLSQNCSLIDLASTFEEIECILHKINNNEFDRPKGYHPRYCDCFKYDEFLNLNEE
jgi:CRISPR/Cas system-associated exonuclease Cas4 (RecB family)